MEAAKNLKNVTGKISRDGMKYWTEKAPKIHLHIHLEGATSPETYLKLARKHDVILPFSNGTDGYKFFQYQSLEHFLMMFRSCTNAICDPQDFLLLIDQFAKAQVAQNVKYCEFYVSLSLYAMRDMDLDQILVNIAHACVKAQLDYGIELHCIPDVSRDRKIEIAGRCIEAIVRNRSKYIIGIGLGGSEQKSTADFQKVFEFASQAGLKTVAHAGEARDTDVIWEAINSLHVMRIGHGVSAITDLTLMEHLKETQLPLEVCPTSNYCTGLIREDEVHPIHLMIKEGLNVTINSDDPMLFNTTLNGELLKLQKAGLTDIQLKELLMRNINAAFITEPEKDKYRRQLDDFYYDIKGELI